jgi:hypothetical protein
MAEQLLTSASDLTHEASGPASTPAEAIHASGEFSHAVDPNRPSAATSEPPKWFNTLPEHLRTSKVTEFKSLDALVESSINKDKLLGKKVSELTKDEIRSFLSPEELRGMAGDNFPQTIEDYKIPMWDTQLEPTLAQEIHKKGFDHGISPEKMSDLIEFQAKAQKDATLKQRQTWRDEIFTKYGASTERELSIAKRALSEFGGKDITAELDRSGLGDNPYVVELFRRIGHSMLEDKIPHNGGRSEGGQAADSLKTEIRNLKNDKQFYKLWSMGDKKASAKMDDLYERLYELEARQR